MIFAGWHEKIIAYWLRRTRHNKLPERLRLGQLEGWLSIWVNFLLFVLKGILGLITGSIALVSDAFHTFSDMATSVVIILGFKYAGKEPDEEHPFGHGRLEQVSTLIVAVLLIVAGIEVARSAWERLFQNPEVHLTPLTLVLVAGTIIIKEWLAHFSSYLGRKIDSGALEADSWHHHTDALSTLLVLGAMWAAAYGVKYVDAVAGLLVVGIILYTGYRILRDSGSTLLGEKPDPQLVEQVVRTATGVEDVAGVHDIIINSYGSTLIITLHIEVDERLTLNHAHTVAERVEELLNNELGARTTVHIDPINFHDPLLREIRAVLSDPHFLEAGMSVHDMRLVGEPPYQNLVFDLLHPPGLSRERRQWVSEQLQRRLKDKFPVLNQVVVHLESGYV